MKKKITVRRKKALPHKRCRCSRHGESDENSRPRSELPFEKCLGQSCGKRAGREGGVLKVIVESKYAGLGAERSGDYRASRHQGANRRERTKKPTPNIRVWGASYRGQVFSYRGTNCLF